MKFYPWLICLIISIGTVFLYPIVLSEITGLNYPGSMGEFGDMYGLLNPIISTLAFFGVLYSLYMQQKQLKLQREDLINQREELELQRAEMVKQREVCEAQTKQFEAQVRLAEVDQKIDEFYRKLSIVIQLSEGITHSRTREKGGVFIERITETGVRAVREIHMGILQQLYNIAENGIAMDTGCHYFVPKYENVACWSESVIDIMRYIINNFEKSSWDTYTRALMSTCSNPHKFLIYLFAGAQCHEEGKELRYFLLNNNIIQQRIIPDFLLNENFLVEFDEMLIEGSTYGTCKEEIK